ncbi:MAG: hypothetical protein J3Q66DRAFT_204994 [Benniella sp.]|nr:MAG: hypothetical protein J3Q66DRAFT_204994 [Benniella sp.]
MSISLPLLLFYTLLSLVSRHTSPTLFPACFSPLASHISHISYLPPPFDLTYTSLYAIPLLFQLTTCSSRGEFGPPLDQLL